MTPEALLERGDGARIVFDAVGQDARFGGDVGQLGLQPASRSASGSKRGSTRATDRASCSACAVASRAPPGSAVRASWTRRRAPGDRFAVLGRRQAAADLVRLADPEPAPPRSRRTRVRPGPAGGRVPAGSTASSVIAARFSRHAATARAIASRGSSCPPYPSSRSRCQRSSSSRCWSCWPWISTSGPISSARRDAVTVASSSRAVERPLAATSRTAIRGSGR